MVVDEPSSSFLAALDPALRPAFEAPALAATLANLLQQARAADPAWSIDDITFVEHVARVLEDGADLATLERLRAADLYLACACAAGEERALAAFETEYGRDIDLAIARSANLPLGRDEFRQMLRDKLFVPQGGRRPKIADYAGRGDLRSWIRVTAVRAVVDIARAQAVDKEVPMETDMLGAVPSPGDDPELDYIQRVYKTEFKEALQEAFGALTARERNLLRHQVLHGLNIDEVGALYRVHRTTAFRWIEKARKSLLRETKSALMKRLRVGQSEFLSIMRVVGGDLEVSVRRMLNSEIERES
jgi:RNA polymerase sigma-70 factor (ECF subfamily)